MSLMTLVSSPSSVRSWNKLHASLETPTEGCYLSRIALQKELADLGLTLGRRSWSFLGLTIREHYDSSS
jgi:hypothetical protein